MRTLAGEGRGKLTEKRSRFLAFAYPVSSRQEIEERLASLRREYHDARHIAYAWRLEGEERADDAGEPSRSAGWPILELLRGRELVNVLVAVVRYFGGVKLGVGGLRRAYRDAAAAALQEAGMIPFTKRERIELSFQPEQSGRVFQLLSQRGGEVLSQDFRAGRMLLLVSLPSDGLEGLAQALGPGVELNWLKPA